MVRKASANGTGAASTNNKSKKPKEDQVEEEEQPDSMDIGEERLGVSVSEKAGATSSDPASESDPATAAAVEETTASSSVTSGEEVAQARRSPPPAKGTPKNSVVGMAGCAEKPAKTKNNNNNNNTNNNNNSEGFDDDSDTVLEVQCGLNKARIYLTRLRQGSRGPCVYFDDVWFTPNEFQQVSGRETAKDWKRSIKHHGKSLKLLMAKGTLTLQPPKCLCEECTGIPSDSGEGPAKATPTPGSPDVKSEEKPKLAPVKDTAATNLKDSAPSDRPGKLNLPEDADGKSGAATTLKKKGGGKKRRKQRDGSRHEGKDEEESLSTNGEAIVGESTRTAAVEDDGGPSADNYKLARIDQDLSGDACKVSPASDERSLGIDTRPCEVETALSKYGFRPKAPETASNDNDDSSVGVDDDDEEIAAENTRIMPTQKENPKGTDRAGRGDSVDDAAITAAATPDTIVPAASTAAVAAAQLSFADTDGHRGVRDGTERLITAADGSHRRPGPEINESITAENREGRNCTETGSKQGLSSAPRAKSILYADAGFSSDDESLKVWRAKTAIDEAAPSNGSPSTTKMQSSLICEQTKQLGGVDIKDKDGGEKRPVDFRPNKAQMNHFVDAFIQSKEGLGDTSGKVFSGRQELGMLLGDHDVTATAAAAAVVASSRGASPAVIEDMAVKLESKAGCGRRLEFNSEQGRRETTPDMQSGVESCNPLQDNECSPAKEARLIDIIHELRSYKKQIIQRIEYQRHTGDDAGDNESKEGLSQEIKRERLFQPETLWRAGAVGDSDQCEARESKSAPNPTQPDWSWHKLRRSSSTENLSAGRLLSTVLREKSKTESPAVFSPRVSTLSAVNYVAPIPRSSIATANGHPAERPSPGVKSATYEDEAAEDKTKNTSRSPLPVSSASLTKGVAATITTSSANIPRVSPYYWHPGTVRVPYYPSLYPGMTSSDYYSYLQGAGVSNNSSSSSSSNRPEDSNNSDRRSLPKCDLTPVYDKCGALDLSMKKRKSDSYLLATEAKKRKPDSHKRQAKPKRVQETPIDLSVKPTLKADFSSARKHNGVLPVSASAAHSAPVSSLGQYRLPVSATSPLTPSLFGSLSPSQAATDPTTAMSMYQLYLYNMYNQQVAAQQNKGGKVSTT